MHDSVLNSVQASLHVQGTISTNTEPKPSTWGVSNRWTGFSTGTWDWNVGLEHGTGMWDRNL